MTELIIFAALISLGFFVGQYLEKRHYASIQMREKQLINLVTTTSKTPVGDVGEISHCTLVSGNAVISIDYFKRIVAGLRAIFGGTVRSYETLIDRSRREAILRLKESCPEAAQIINLRIETSSVFKGKKNDVGSVEVLAYGTAVYIK